VKERTETLLDIIDDEMEDLDFEEGARPFKILSFTVSPELIKGILAGCVTLAFPLVSKHLNVN